MEDYGLRLYVAGLVVHRDHRPRVSCDGGIRPAVAAVIQGGRRGGIAAFSESSRRRLEFVAANCCARFRTLVTLTYHARVEAWETDAVRNRRIVKRSKRDLNRFLARMRREMGPYLWIQEFQSRGVIHYHLLCEGGLSPERCVVVWTRATGELDDADALRHAVRVESVSGQKQVRSYLGRYLGKQRQKLLPPGVEGAGRWWGRSRRLELEIVREIVTHGRENIEVCAVSAKVLRSLRRWLSGRLKFRIRGGQLVDWSGRLSADGADVIDGLLAFYGLEAVEVRS
jgi:hypothetical protein